jgi:hypothetical protein
LRAGTTFAVGERPRRRTCDDGAKTIAGMGPPFLVDGQIFVIRRWIEIGAPSN